MKKRNSNGFKLEGNHSKLYHASKED